MSVVDDVGIHRALNAETRSREEENANMQGNERSYGSAAVRSDTDPAGHIPFVFYETVGLVELVSALGPAFR